VRPPAVRLAEPRLLAQINSNFPEPDIWITAGEKPISRYRSGPFVGSADVRWLSSERIRRAVREYAWACSFGRRPHKNQTRQRAPVGAGIVRERRPSFIRYRGSGNGFYWDVKCSDLSAIVV